MVRLCPYRTESFLERTVQFYRQKTANILIISRIWAIFYLFFSILRSLLYHRVQECHPFTPLYPATSAMLEESISIGDQHWIISLMLAFFYPVLGILSIFPIWPFKDFRILLSTYPTSFYVNWGSYLWTEIILFMYQNTVIIV